MAEHDQQAPVPPYASWTTIRNMIDRMAKQGVPARIDNSYLIGMAGGTQNQVKHALRSMDLINDEGATTPRLIHLVKDADDRPKLVRELLQQRYPRLVDLDLDTTRGQLDDAIKSYGLNGATARKAASFFIAAATFAELPLSPHFPTTRPGGSSPSGSSATRKRTSAKRKPATSADSESPSPASYSTSIDLGDPGDPTTLILAVRNPNPFSLPEADRNFFFSLVDQIRNYAANRDAPPADNGVAAETPDEGGAS